MAGDWIKMRGNLWDDPRIARICDITGESEAAVIGGLYWLWAAADQHTEDGVMQGLSTRGIDRKTGIKGFGEALVEIGWLADHPEGVRIVNFEEHNGTSAKKRCQTAKRVAAHKAANACDDEKEDEGNAVSVTEALSERYLEKEKRREDKKEPIGSSLAATRRKRIPSDFSPNQTGLELAIQKGLTVEDELQKFTDYHSAKGSVMADWQAAWRTWVGNASSFAKQSSRPIVNKQTSLEQRNKAAGAEWLRQQGIAR